MKENVIIGKLIPAGTGSGFDRESTRKIMERANEIREEIRIRNLKEEESLPKEVLEGGKTTA